jgi:circadian clock protein KaiC
MSHSNQIREFRLTDDGIQLLDVYVGANGVLTGSARLSQESKDDADILARQEQISLKQYGLQRKRDAMEAQVAVLRAEFESEESEGLTTIRIDKAKLDQVRKDEVRMGKSRRSDAQKKSNGKARNNK